jgi:hypothetical protein
VVAVPVIGNVIVVGRPGIAGVIDKLGVFFIGIICFLVTGLLVQNVFERPLPVLWQIPYFFFGFRIIVFHLEDTILLCLLQERGEITE